MKTLVLEEERAPLVFDEGMLAEGPVRVLHGDRTIGVLVPPDEYELFRAWQTAHMQSAPPPAEPDDEFRREVEAFERMLPELLQKYRGRVVAIRHGEVVLVGEPGEEVADVVGKVYERFGHGSVYVQKVEETPRVYRITGPRLVRA